MKCATCGGPVNPALPPKTPSSFCSYWCSLVGRGEPGFTLERITPWLVANRGYVPPPVPVQAEFDLGRIA